jgi:hypothetical protein
MSYPTSIAVGLSFCIEEPGTSVKLGEIANATVASVANTLVFSISVFSTIRILMATLLSCLLTPSVTGTDQRSICFVDAEKLDICRNSAISYLFFFDLLGFIVFFLSRVVFMGKSFFVINF